MNRVHPLVIVNMFVKFDEDVHNSLVAIAFTRIRRDTLKDAQTDGTIAALLYPLHNTLRGDNKVGERARLGKSVSCFFRAKIRLGEFKAE